MLAVNAVIHCFSSDIWVTPVCREENSYFYQVSVSALLRLRKKVVVGSACWEAPVHIAQGAYLGVCMVP